ncbi:hypothetical protein ACFL40_03340 [candidate division KSB1 bacterium]
MGDIMVVLFWGLGIYLLSFILHLLIWKIKLPKKQTRALIIIFSGTFIFCLVILSSILSLSGCYSEFIPGRFLEFLHISLFFISLTLAYIITYSGVEVDSPALVMVMIIKKYGLDGIDKKELEEIITDDLLIKPRVEDLLFDRMAYMEGEKYKLTPKGVLFASIFRFYRRLINAPKGG